MNQINLYKLNGQIYGLSKSELNDTNLSKETYTINENIKELSILHNKGVCKVIKIYTYNHQSFNFGEGLEDNKIL